MPDQAEPNELTKLLNRHGSALVLFAAQWADSPEDCVQEAFIELAAQRTMPDNVAAWLFKVARNRAISMARATQRRRRHETLAARLIPQASNATDRPPVDAEELAAALQTLDDEQREVIVAKIWGQLGFEQIAEVVGTSTSSAHRRYAAGLEALKKQLGVACPKNTNTTAKS